MPISRTELLAVVDEVNVAEAIANFAQVKEAMVDDAVTDSAKESVERQKFKTDDAKRQLFDLKDR